MSGDLEDNIVSIKKNKKSKKQIYGLFSICYDGDGYLEYSLLSVHRSIEGAKKKVAKLPAQDGLGQPAFDSMTLDNNYTIVGRRKDLGLSTGVDRPMGFVIEKLKLKK